MFLNVLVLGRERIGERLIGERLARGKRGPRDTLGNEGLFGRLGGGAKYSRYAIDPDTNLPVGLGELVAADMGRDYPHNRMSHIDTGNPDILHWTDPEVEKVMNQSIEIDWSDDDAGTTTAATGHAAPPTPAAPARLGQNQYRATFPNEKPSIGISFKIDEHEQERVIIINAIKHNSEAFYAEVVSSSGRYTKLSPGLKLVKINEIPVTSPEQCKTLLREEMAKPGKLTAVFEKIEQQQQPLEFSKEPVGGVATQSSLLTKDLALPNPRAVAGEQLAAQPFW